MKNEFKKISNNKIALLFLLFLCFGTSLINILSPITKQEMLEISKSHHCPIRLNFRYGDSISYYDSCMSILKNDFSKLSTSDKADVVVSFILYGNLDASVSEEFFNLIQPYHLTLFKYLDTIQEKEIRSKFEVSYSEIANYHKKLNHYKNTFSQ